MSPSLFRIVITLLISLVAGLQQQQEEFRRDDFPADFVFGSGSSAYQVSLSLSLSTFSTFSEKKLFIYLFMYVCMYNVLYLYIRMKVEGAAFEDGRTPSIWDTFAHSGHLTLIHSFIHYC